MYNSQLLIPRDSECYCVPAVDNSVYCHELLTSLVILKDTSAWQRDLCQLMKSREPFIVYYVINGFTAKEV